MNYLIRTTETYRVPNEEAVKKLLEELKSNRMFEIVKYSSIKKERKVRSAEPRYKGFPCGEAVAAGV